MLRKHYLLRGLLVFISVYHIACGIIANTTPEGILWAARRLAGVSLTPDNPQLFYIARPFGVYVFCFGILMGLAAIRPAKYRGVIAVGVLLFVVRALQRLILAPHFESLFNVPHWRNMISVGIVSLFALALLILRLRLGSDIRKHGLPDEEQPLST